MSFNTRHPNQTKYLKEPSWEQIRKVIDAHGVNDQQFERFYGISGTMLQKVRRGQKKLPVKHWHVIYECLRMIDENKPMPVYKDEQPQIPETTPFKINIPFFNKPKKKKSKKSKTIKRTGTLCELC